MRMAVQSTIAERLKPLDALKGRESTHLLINEIYASIQGESTHAGRPCTFIRTAVCNQRCSYCDTAYAFTQGEAMHIDDVMRRVLGTRVVAPATLPVEPDHPSPAGLPVPLQTSLVEITGGEPLLQPLFPELCRRLLADGCEVLVETGGSHDISIVPEGVHVILDVKTPGSGEEHANDYGNLRRARAGDEAKFVLTGRADYEWARDLVHRERLHQRTTVLFSPAWKLLEPAELASWMLEDGVPARLNLQLHKYIWGNRRGV
jgi:7-carboxy-7-deazaguanine synthase